MLKKPGNAVFGDQLGPQEPVALLNFSKNSL